MTENEQKLLDNGGHAGHATLHSRRIEINDVNTERGVELMVHDEQGGCCHYYLTIPECLDLANELTTSAQDLLRDLLRK